MIFNINFSIKTFIKLCIFISITVSGSHQHNYIMAGGASNLTGGNNSSVPPKEKTYNPSIHFNQQKEEKKTKIKKKKSDEEDKAGDANTVRYAVEVDKTNKADSDKYYTYLDKLDSSATCEVFCKWRGSVGNTCDAKANMTPIKRAAIHISCLKGKALTIMQKAYDERMRNAKLEHWRKNNNNTKKKSGSPTKDDDTGKTEPELDSITLPKAKQQEVFELAMNDLALKIFTTDGKDSVRVQKHYMRYGLPPFKEIGPDAFIDRLDEMNGYFKYFPRTRGEEPWQAC